MAKSSALAVVHAEAAASPMLIVPVSSRQPEDGLGPLPAGEIKADSKQDRYVNCQEYQEQ